MRAAWFDFRFIPLNFDLQGDRISVCLLGKLSMEGSLYGTRGFFSLAFYHWDCLDAKSWSDCKISEELYWTWLDIIWDGEWEKKVNFQLWGSCFGLTCSRTSWCQTLHCPTVDPGWLTQTANVTSTERAAGWDWEQGHFARWVIATCWPWTSQLSSMHYLRKVRSIRRTPAPLSLLLFP